MVPPGMVKKMYGASIFYDEVIKAVEKEIQEYLNQRKTRNFCPAFADGKRHAEISICQIQWTTIFHLR